ncbi:MAG: nucleoside triphosphate pyrophosphohydrolase family protein [Gemmatimonadaceae bacterium]|nr:nucleoside triphosphate pyrophosphohydrolase family protein [Actinomycetota bacterium]
MNFNSYQTKAYSFALYPGEINLAYPVMGLTGEAGEIANKVKKIYRDGLDGSEIRDDIKAELGDVLWYLAALATEFGLDLADVATANIRKLESRQRRGVIGGSGDNR